MRSNARRNCSSSSARTTPRLPERPSGFNTQGNGAFSAAARGRIRQARERTPVPAVPRLEIAGEPDTCHGMLQWLWENDAEFRALRLRAPPLVSAGPPRRRFSQTVPPRPVCRTSREDLRNALESHDRPTDPRARGNDRWPALIEPQPVRRVREHACLISGRCRYQ